MNRFICWASALLLALAPVIAPARGHGGGHSSQWNSHGHSSGGHRSHGGHHSSNSNPGPRYHSSSRSHHSGHGMKRDPKQKARFRRTHPCPSTGRTHGACPGYVVDHIRALKHGGRDDPSNMQWQSKAAAKAKDRWE